MVECSPVPENRVPNLTNQVSSSGENSATGNEDGNVSRSSLPTQSRINGTISTYNHGNLEQKKGYFLFACDLIQ